MEFLYNILPPAQQDILQVAFLYMYICIFRPHRNKVLYREALPWGPTTELPFIYHFWQKRYPFRIHVPKSDDKCHTFHLLSLELCIPLNCCECTVFKKWINQKTRKFFRFSHSHKMHLLALSSLFTHRNSSTLSSYTSTSEACKRYPFRALSLPI